MGSKLLCLVRLNMSQEVFLLCYLDCIALTRWCTWAAKRVEERGDGARLGLGLGSARRILVVVRGKFERRLFCLGRKQEQEGIEGIDGLGWGLSRALFALDHLSVRSIRCGFVGIDDLRWRV